jgi:hypothetical protein
MRFWGQLQKIALFLLIVAACTAVGLIAPQAFDRDVGGALASTLLAGLGALIGAVIAWYVIRRKFD